MAMNKDQLGQEIVDAIKSVTGGAETPQVLAIWQAISKAIIDHLIANAEVTVEHSGPQTGGITG